MQTTGSRFLRGQLALDSKTAEISVESRALNFTRETKEVVVDQMKFTIPGTLFTLLKSLKRMIIKGGIC
jgi:hypothetical protein